MFGHLALPASVRSWLARRAERQDAPILDEGLITPSEDLNGVRLLASYYGVVPFQGRTAEMEQLDRWADSAQPVAIRLIHGPGGAGKTRFVAEWLKVRRARIGQHEAQSWLQGLLRWLGLWSPRPVTYGFLSGKLDDRALAFILENTPVCVAIDYAEAREGLKGFLNRLATARPAAPVRVLLIARHAGEWWAELRASSSRELRDLLSRLDSERALGPLLDAGTVKQEVARAIEAFSRHLGRPVQADAIIRDPGHFDVLYVHMAALAASLDLRVHDEQLAEALLDHEERLWRHRLRLDDADEDIASERIRGARALATALTLRGGLARRDQLPELLASLQLTGVSSAAVEAMFPGRPSRWVSGVEPDLLGEALVRRTILDPGRPPKLIQDMLGGADEASWVHAFTVLGRIAARFHDEVPLSAAVRQEIERLLSLGSTQHIAAFRAGLALGHEVLRSELGDLLARTLEAQGDPATAELIGPELPWYTISMADVAIWVDRTRLRGLSTQPEDVEERVRVLTDLGRRLDVLGQYDVALTVSEEAAALCAGALAGGAGAVARRLMASCHYYLAVRFERLGRNEEALQEVLSAVIIHIESYNIESNKSKKALTNSMVYLAKVLLIMDHRDDALQVIRWATDSYRALYLSGRDEYRLGYGLALLNLGRSYRASRRPQRALKVLDQAAAVFRTMIQGHREDGWLNLAACLSTSGLVHKAVRQLPQALADTSEALKIHRMLAALRPEAFTHHLIRCLRNQGLVLGGVGRFEEGLAETAAAVALSKTMSERWRRLHADDCVSCLCKLADRQLALGHRNEALASAKEALEIIRAMPSTSGRWERQLLAETLEALVRTQSALGQADPRGLADEARDLRASLGRAPRVPYAEVLSSVMGRLRALFDTGSEESPETEGAPAMDSYPFTSPSSTPFQVDLLALGAPPTSDGSEEEDPAQAPDQAQDQGERDPHGFYEDPGMDLDPY